MKKLLLLFLMVGAGLAVYRAVKARQTTYPELDTATPPL